MMKMLDNHELRMTYAKLIADINDATNEKYGDLETEVSFEFEGFNVHNPFMDVTGRFEVDPIEEYGDSFINSKFYNPIELKSLYDGRLILSECYEIISNSGASLSFDSSLDALAGTYNMDSDYFTDEMILSIYFELSEGKLVDANELVGDLEAEITGRGSIYNVECLKSLIGDGYEWIDFEMHHKIYIVAENIKQLLIDSL